MYCVFQILLKFFSLDRYIFLKMVSEVMKQFVAILNATNSFFNIYLKDNNIGSYNNQPGGILQFLLPKNSQGLEPTTSPGDLCNQHGGVCLLVQLSSKTSLQHKFACK